MDGGERFIQDDKGNIVTSGYLGRFLNSIIIAVISTFLAVAMGTITAYGFSRFKMPGESDWLFFILSTRMLPPVVVAIPMYLMYRSVALVDTHVGLIILYTAFNLSFSVWVMKGFMDEIPREYEEAALVDGYTRMQAFIRSSFPRPLLASPRRRFSVYHGLERICLCPDHDPPQSPDRPSLYPVAARFWADRLVSHCRWCGPVPDAGDHLHLPPRNHLLRGVTFGAVRK